MKILVTGSAGFIGFHVASSLLQQSCDVVGIDNLSPYYDVGLKESRLSLLQKHPNFEFELLDLSQSNVTVDFFKNRTFDHIIHFAAQPGARHSTTHPLEHLQHNIVGFLSVLEGCRAIGCPHLVYASSSSVYGSRDPETAYTNLGHQAQPVPLLETVATANPESIYAVSKISNELMAQVYSKQYDFATTGLRLFTVYGPWGRPDMAYWKFTQSLLAEQPIDVYGNGLLKRDFTFIDDVVSGINRILEQPIEKTRELNRKSQIFNLGSNSPVSVNTLISILENVLGKKATVNLLPMQRGDVDTTNSDMTKFNKFNQFLPATNLEDGLRLFCDWYLENQNHIDSQWR
jgi:UDP-glucuronate 4-epimerase